MKIIGKQPPHIHYRSQIHVQTTMLRLKLASGIKQRPDGSLWEGMLYKGVVSAGHSHPCPDLLNPYLKGKVEEHQQNWRGQKTFSLVQCMQLESLDLYKLTWSFQSHQTLLHTQRNRVQNLGHFFPFFRDLLSTLLGRMVPEDMPKTIRISYQLKINNIS